METVLILLTLLINLYGINSEIPTKPNIVMILADDMGYGDLASYGHPTQEYGPLDQMANDGLRFTQAYSADTVCSPSRGSLLIGRLPVRSGLWGEGHRVFLPWLTNGLPREEITMAEILRENGYATGFVGKWHLGINRNESNDGYHLPWHHGFDFVGHMIPFGGSYDCDTTGRVRPFPDTAKCAYYYNQTIKSQPYHQENITLDFVSDFKDFVNINKDQAFFFFYSMMHPHAPLYSSERFKGSSKRGRYGDNINELSWAVGEIRDTIASHGLSENTLIVFMSDHGPHREYCADGGDAGIWRGYKSNSYEGGYRVPLIVYWPDVVVPGVITDEVFSALDLFPIFVDLAGGTLPEDVAYDGVNPKEVLLGMQESQRDFILYYNRNELFAVRLGKYKVHFKTQRDLSEFYFGTHQCFPEGQPPEHFFDCNRKEGDCVTEHDPPLLFDLSNDPTEAWPLDSSLYPDVMEGISYLIEEHRKDLIAGEPLMDAEDHAVEPCCNPDTNCVCNFVL